MSALGLAMATAVFVVPAASAEVGMGSKMLSHEQPGLRAEMVRRPHVAAAVAVAVAVVMAGIAAKHGLCWPTDCELPSATGEIAVSGLVGILGGSPWIFVR